MLTNSLVIHKFSISTQPLPMPTPTVEIVGRRRGIVAFFLSLIGFSPITRFILAGNQLCARNMLTTKQGSKMFSALKSVFCNGRSFKLVQLVNSLRQ